MLRRGYKSFWFFAPCAKNIYAARHSADKESSLSFLRVSGTRLKMT